MTLSLRSQEAPLIGFIRSLFVLGVVAACVGLGPGEADGQGAAPGAAGTARAASAAAPPRADAQDSIPPLTLDAALREARAHNAQLPVAQAAVSAAIARTLQARGQLYPTFSLGSDLHTGAPQKYASTDAFLRVVGDAPIYDGGALRANLAQADAEARAFEYGYRMSLRDVDHAVRAGYARVLRADTVMNFREGAVARLEAYLSVVRSRRAAGEGVGSDLLRTEQRVAAARADISAVRQEGEDARMALNDILGRAPDAPLALTPLPTPASPEDTTGAGWRAIPDIAATRAQIRAAEAGVQAAHAGRKLHVSLEADVGAQPYLGSDAALLNNGQGAGGEVFLNFTLPFLDFGIYRGQLAEANANLQQARGQANLTERTVRLNWSRASAAVSGLYREYQDRSRAVTAAQDAYLEAESLYRGGQGTALDVLDAYDAWVQAEQNRLDVVYAYRVARADLIRWGTP